MMASLPKDHNAHGEAIGALTELAAREIPLEAALRLAVGSGGAPSAVPGASHLEARRVILPMRLPANIILS